MARDTERRLEAEYAAETELVERTRKNPRRNRGGRLKRIFRERASVIAAPEELAEIGPGEAAEPPAEHQPSPAPRMHPEPAQMPHNRPVRGREPQRDPGELMEALVAERLEWPRSIAALTFLGASARTDIASRTEGRC
jgi:hypothetical protein